MHVFASNLFRQLVATALIVSMSMCCCNFDTFVGGLSGAVAGSSHDQLAVSIDGRSDSCCSSKSIESRNISHDPAPSPIKGCDCCGVKGVVLSTAVGEVSGESIWFWHELPNKFEIVLNSPTVVADSALVVVEPPTLLRQCCALII